MVYSPSVSPVDNSVCALDVGDFIDLRYSACNRI